MKKKTACLGYIGDEILPSYLGVIISHYKDPFSKTQYNEMAGSEW